MLLAVGAAAALTRPASAQPARGPVRIGWLATYPWAAWPLRDLFTESMRDLGHVEGRDYAIDLLAYEGHNERIPALAAELVRRRPALIVASASPQSLRLRADEVIE